MFKPIFGVVALAAALASQPVAAQDQQDAQTADPVLATVNGTAVTQSEMALASSSLGNALQGVPEDQRRDMVLDLLIDMHLLADAAEKSGVPDEEEFQKRAEWARTQALREVYMDKIIAEKVSEEAIRQRYEEEIAKLAPQQEVSARHILVADEETARDLISELDGGADFAALAEEHSTDPGTAENGGSLGFFSRGQMVPEFEKAAFDLAPGEVTQEPVKSQFGWHVIKVDETREQPVPPLDQVADQIRQILVSEVYRDEVARLKESAEIERTTSAQAE